MSPAPVTLHGLRVRLRPWRLADRAPFAALNADAEVMRHFAAPLSRADSDAMADRITALFETRGWGLWALETDSLAFAGFVGLGWVPFTLPVPGFEGPQLEIGWRLARAAWGQGLATEAALLAQQFAHQLVLASPPSAAPPGPRLVSVTAHSNTRSVAVMQRIGLQRVAEFDHPRLPGHALQRHLLYAAALPAQVPPTAPTRPDAAADPAARSQN